MAQKEGRVIKPPIKEVISGRVFHPDNAFLYKKWLRVFILIVFFWAVLWLVFFSHPAVVFIVLEIAEWTDLIVNAGWITISQAYWIIASTFFFIWVVYTYIYVKRINYSLASWEGEVSPEVYVKKGIIKITQRHVPFRTITYVKTTRGVFDRLFSIGTVQIETAAKSIATQGGGLIALILQRLMRGGAAEENIEGVKFHEELRDFILRELRSFDRAPVLHAPSEKVSKRKSVFNRDTLEAFREIRDALILQQQER